jgi:PAS domain S-box-containing protein
LKSRISKIKKNEQSTDSKKLEIGRGKLWISVKFLSILCVILGFIVIAGRYYYIPALSQIFPDWASMQFNIVLGLLLVAMGGFLAFVTSFAFKIWRKGESLRKNLEVEINRRKTAEKDLAHAREISKMGNWELELSDLEMRWSDEVYRIMDCSSKNTVINFRRFLISVHPDDRVFVNNEIQKVLGQGTAFNLSYRIICRDGSIRIVKQRSEVYLDQKGKPFKILGTIQDITGQREAENLAASLGRIVDKSFNEIYTFDTETFKIVKVNLAARLNLRYKTEELFEMTPVDLLPEFTREQVEELTGSLKRGIKSETFIETVHKRKNGTFYPVEIRLQLSRTETLPQFVAIVQDITHQKKVESLFGRSHQDLDRQVFERTTDLTKLNKNLQIKIRKQKKAIEALDASEHHLIEIMNNVVDSIITIDEEGTIHSFNRAAEHLFGFNVEEALGQNINTLMAGSEDSQRDQYFKNLLQSEKSAALGLRRMVTARKKDGTKFSAELAVTETVIGGQRMFTGLIRNLSEKKEIVDEDPEVHDEASNCY